LELKMQRALLALVLLLTSSIASAASPAAASRDTLQIADRQVTVGQQRVRYLEAGAGSTLVVLVHGWPASADSWREVIPLLSDKFRVIAPDLRGIGGSSSPSDDYSKAALARDLHAFVQSRGARRVVIVGHDIGGMVAYAYARQFPRDVAAVAILDVPLPGIASWDQIATAPHAWHFDFHAQEPLAESLVAGKQERYFRYFIDQTAGNARAISDAEVRRFARAYSSSAQLSAGFGFYRTFDADKTFNRAQTRPLAVPMLLMGGDKSFAHMAEELATALKQLGASNVRTALVKDSGHWVAEEQPAQTARLIADFADLRPTP
jgi:pimeloyl-ACP methyl ester carboxylesterase